MENIDESTNTDRGVQVNRLSAEKVNQTVQNCFERISFLAKQYTRGWMTKDEFYNRAREVLYGRGFTDFSGGLHLIIDNSSWERLLADYQRWKDRLAPCSDVGDPWLEIWDYGEKKREASISDKCQFFRLMEAFSAHIDIFEPMPETIVHHEKEHLHTYNGADAVWIGFNCVDDGGLLTEPNPCGKTFTLKSDKGLKAVLYIKQGHGTRTNMVKGLGEEFDFRCSGYIEGYTADCHRDTDIYILLSQDKQITGFGTHMDNRDYKEFYAFPLWQKCHEWNRIKMEKIRRGEENFFDSFISKIDNFGYNDST